MQLNIEQQVFMLFFAIVWGNVANVQPRWKAFQWPLFFSFSKARHRVFLSVLCLNLLPIFFFGYVLWANSFHEYNNSLNTISVIIRLIIHSVIPAFSVFGFYRLWLGIIEHSPNYFYANSPYELQVEFRHVEPTFVVNALQTRLPNCPVVELNPKTAWVNLVVAIIYIGISMLFPWLNFWCY